MTVRKVLFSMGYRYRLHVKDLPGTPDIVFRSRQKAIFVHGCFWHALRVLMLTSPRAIIPSGPRSSQQTRSAIGGWRLVKGGWLENPRRLGMRALG